MRRRSDDVAVIFAGVGLCGVIAPRWQYAEASLCKSVLTDAASFAEGDVRISLLLACVGLMILLQGDTEHKQQAEEGGSENQAAQFYV